MRQLIYPDMLEPRYRLGADPILKQHPKAEGIRRVGCWEVGVGRWLEKRSCFGILSFGILACSLDLRFLEDFLELAGFQLGLEKFVGVNGFAVCLALLERGCSLLVGSI